MRVFYIPPLTNDSKGEYFLGEEIKAQRDVKIHLERFSHVTRKSFAFLKALEFNSETVKLFK